MANCSAAPIGAWVRARQLDGTQRARLRRATRDAAQLYPRNPGLQRAAVDAAIEYLLGSTDLVDTATAWDRARGEEQRIRARVRQIAVMAVADNMSERSVARAIGVDRMTLRRWSGKTAHRAHDNRPGLRRGERR